MNSSWHCYSCGLLLLVVDRLQDGLGEVLGRSGRKVFRVVMSNFVGRVPSSGPHSVIIITTVWSLSAPLCAFIWTPFCGLIWSTLCALTVGSHRVSPSGPHSMLSSRPHSFAHTLSVWSWSAPLGCALHVDGGQESMGQVGGTGGQCDHSWVSGGSFRVGILSGGGMHRRC